MVPPITDVQAAPQVQTVEVSDSATEVEPNLDDYDASGTESFEKDLVSVVTPQTCKFESLQLEPGNSDEEVQEYVRFTKTRAPEVSASPGRL